MVDTPKKDNGRVPWGSGRVAFMAHRQHIEEMLAKGYPKSTIYEELKPKLNGLSYTQFSVLARKKLGASDPGKAVEKPIAPTGLKPPTELPGEAAEPAKKWNPKRNEGTGFKSFVPGPVVPDPSEHW